MRFAKLLPGSLLIYSSVLRVRQLYQKGGQTTMNSNAERELLAGKLLLDPKFRQTFISDPDSTASSLGIKLTEQERLVGKLLLDSEFRQNFSEEAGREAARCQFNLSEQQMDKFRAINLNELDALSGQLDEVLRRLPPDLHPGWHPGPIEDLSPENRH